VRIGFPARRGRSAAGHLWQTRLEWAPKSHPEHPVPQDDAIAEKTARPKLPPKDEVRALLDRLPDDVTLEDIQYHLDVVVKVLEAEADTSGDISHDEAKQQFAQWFAK
jgi:hypothetical protein